MPDVTRIIEQTATESIYNDDWAIIDRPTEGEDGGTRKILVSKLKELLCGDYIADEWESLVTYNNGRFVTREGKLYYNNSGGALRQITFKSNAWLEVKVEDFLSILTTNFAPLWQANETYSENDIRTHGGKIYHCKVSTSTLGTWVNSEWEIATVLDLIANAGQIDDIVADEVSLIDENKVADLTSLAAVGSASGAIATFDDGSDLPMPSLKVSIESVQSGSGAPSPTNVRPISGWDKVNVTRCGKNLFDKVNCGVYNGYISGVKVYGSPNHRTIYIPCKPNTTYSCKNFSGNNRSALSYSSEVPSASTDIGYTTDETITTDANAKYLLCYCYNANSDTVTFDDVKNALDIELGSVVPTSYSAYNGHTYTIDFVDGSNPLTVYGGTLDVVSGTLVVDRVSVDLGTLNWTYSSETNRERFSSAFSGVKWVSDSIPINAICSALVVTDFYTVYNHFTDNTIGMWHGTTLAVYSSAYTDVATFKTAMDGVKLVYELATPLTIQLTPTAVKSLLGVNNIWADTGNVLDAEYIRDTTTIINSLIARIEALENS